MGFIEMSEGAGKKIAISVVIMGAAIAMFIYNMGGGGPNIPPVRALICYMPECGHFETFDLESEQDKAKLKEMDDARNEVWLANVEQQNPELAQKYRAAMENPQEMFTMDMMMMATPTWGTYPNYPYQCPECSKDSMFNAIVCRKCQNVFKQHDEKGQSSDKCPKCGYSRKEERDKERKAEKAAEKEKRTKKRDKNKED